MLEADFKGAPNDLRDVRSVTKSVLSLLVGIALDKGLLPSVDHTIGESLPELVPSFGADKTSLRLRDLLPLGIEQARWEQLRDGSTNVAAGLELRTRDLVRIGRLVLQRGAWGDRQVVSPAWIEASTSARIVLGPELSYG